jgi:hypothetical protein
MTAHDLGHGFSDTGHALVGLPDDGILRGILSENDARPKDRQPNQN